MDWDLVRLVAFVALHRLHVRRLLYHQPPLPPSQDPDGAAALPYHTNIPLARYIPATYLHSHPRKQHTPATISHPLLPHPHLHTQHSRALHTHHSITTSSISSHIITHITAKTKPSLVFVSSFFQTISECGLCPLARLSPQLVPPPLHPALLCLRYVRPSRAPLLLHIPKVSISMFAIILTASTRYHERQPQNRARPASRACALSHHLSRFLKYNSITPVEMCGVNVIPYAVDAGWAPGPLDGVGGVGLNSLVCNAHTLARMHVCSHTPISSHLSGAWSAPPRSRSLAAPSAAHLLPLSNDFPSPRFPHPTAHTVKQIITADTLFFLSLDS